jgi:MFS family permease
VSERAFVAHHGTPLADITPAHFIGASYGLRQSLDTIGAFLGPATAILLMLAFANNFQIVFWAAVIPAFIAVTILVFTVKEPAHVSELKPNRKLRFGDVKLLPISYWTVVGVSTVLTLARFSEAFLILRSQNVGVPIAFVPGVMIVMNLVYAFTAYPAGLLSDRWGRKSILGLGIAFLIFADIILALGPTISMTMAGVALWGLHMGLTQGLFSSLVADRSPTQLRGTAFGFLNLASGVAMLVASVIAGGLWDSYGPSVTFFAGACFSTLGFFGLFFIRKSHVVA